jgi:hypothetical protein
MKKRALADIIQELMKAESHYMKHWPKGIRPMEIDWQDRMHNFGAWPFGPGGAPRDFYFENSDLFIAHNWGNQRMLDRARKKHSEKDTIYWSRLLDISRLANLDLDHAFVGNILPGYKEGPAAGLMSNNREYLEDGKACFFAQLDILQPSRIIVLGGDSESLLQRFLKGRQSRVEVVIIMHPSARRINWGGSKEEWLARQATKITRR